MIRTMWALLLLLSVGTMTPAQADENSDALMLFGLMLAPLVTTVAPPTERPVAQAAQQPPSRTVPRAPSPLLSGHGPFAGERWSDSPKVRAEAMVAGNVLAVLALLLGIGILTVTTVATVRLNRRIAQAKTSGRRIMVR